MGCHESAEYGLRIQLLRALNRKKIAHHDLQLMHHEIKSPTGHDHMNHQTAYSNVPPHFHTLAQLVHVGFAGHSHFFHATQSKRSPRAQPSSAPTQPAAPQEPHPSYPS